MIEGVCALNSNLYLRGDHLYRRRALNSNLYFRGDHLYRRVGLC